MLSPLALLDRRLEVPGDSDEVASKKKATARVCLVAFTTGTLMAFSTGRETSSGPPAPLVSAMCMTGAGATA
eukprot:gene23402-57467_t